MKPVSYKGAVSRMASGNASDRDSAPHPQDERRPYKVAGQRGLYIKVTPAGGWFGDSDARSVI